MGVGDPALGVGIQPGGRGPRAGLAVRRPPPRAPVLIHSPARAQKTQEPDSPPPPPGTQEPPDHRGRGCPASDSAPKAQAGWRRCEISFPGPPPAAHLPLGPPAHVLGLGPRDGHTGLLAAPQPVSALLGPWALGPPAASAETGRPQPWHLSGPGWDCRPPLQGEPRRPGPRDSPPLDDAPATVGVPGAEALYAVEVARALLHRQPERLGAAGR